MPPFPLADDPGAEIHAQHVADITAGQCPLGHGPFADRWCVTCQGAWSATVRGDGTVDVALELLPIVPREERDRNAAALREVLARRVDRTPRQDEVLGVLERRLQRAAEEGAADLDPRLVDAAARALAAHFGEAVEDEIEGAEVAVRGALGALHAGQRLGAHVLVPADLLKRAALVDGYGIRHDARRLLELLAALVYTDTSEAQQ